MNIAKNADPIKILTVINGKSECPNQYAVQCTDDLENDVRKAFEELSLTASNDVVEDIVQDLLHGRSYWYDELYCFEIIPVKLSVSI